MTRSEPSGATGSLDTDIPPAHGVADGPNGRPADPSHGTLRPLGLGEVVITGGFLGHLQQRNRDASLAHIEYWLEREGWLGNFDAAVEGRLPEARRGREFADTEVYKLLEGLAWEFGRTHDPRINDKFKRIAVRVVAAQEADGYLNTNFGRPGQARRYSDLEWGHELYSFGHLIQAGVARARTVGEDDDFVRAVRRAADHVCEVFGPEGIQSVCGHPEIEPALVELYRVTGERRYLDQARLFVERRGHQVLDDIEYGRSYYQDDVPVRDANVLRGHAVRATYLSAGAVDVAVETEDEGLLQALRRQWDNTVAARTYITGGMGSRHQDEAFGEDFVLPADRAYSETCAGVGSLMFSWRLLLADGDSRYADLIERTLYNVIAASPSNDGRSFFYTNTLHQRELGTLPDPQQAVGRAASSLRAPWFGVSCCPTNLARTFASLAGYVATTDTTGVQLHQYAPAIVRTTLPDGRAVALETRTAYPRNGRIDVRILGDSVGTWTLSVRIPQWADGAEVIVNGDAQPVEPAGYARLARDFKPGDTVEILLPMNPRFTAADPRVDAARGCVAVERGPEVMCLESVDTPDRVHVDLLRLDEAAGPREVDGSVLVTMRTMTPPETQGAWPYIRHSPVTTRKVSKAEGPRPAADEPTASQPAHDVVLRPYHTWGNRGPATMRVWLPVTAA